MDTENNINSVLPQQAGTPSQPRDTEPDLLNPDPITRAIDRWPIDRPLAVLTAGRPDRTDRDTDRDTDPDTDPSRSVSPRWTILASPAAYRPIFDPSELDDLLAPRDTPPRADPGSPPFRSGRLVMLTYELGHALEPAAGMLTPRTRLVSGPRSPLGFIADCPETFAFEHTTGRWSAPPPHDPPRDRTGRNQQGLIQEGPQRTDPPSSPGYRLAPLSSETGADAYRDTVGRALGYIRAGDVYQVNLAHRLSAPFEGSPRALASDLFSSASPAHGLYAELPADHQGRRACVLSASPELYLAFEPATRTVRTSPMKGTRPITGDPDELRKAEKDRAELDMITDLMRNDLGRVCAFGSMRVDAARTIEAHGSSVWQATSTVSGTLRDGVSSADLVRAAFPPGSVTGAPKVRAMQIIHELEPVARGYYCGALGWLDDSGTLSLNVGIRTATIALDKDDRGRLTYHAGAGIVAESDPEAEWSETLGKAEVLARHASD